jgi:hypothetical protein
MPGATQKLHHGRENGSNLSNVMKLVEASQNKVTDKVINYERL